MTLLDGRPWPQTARHLDDLIAVLVAGASLGEETHHPSRGFTQLDHGLQCAELLRTMEPDDVELQVAGLLHDIGHTLAPGDVEAHGRTGRAWVQPLLGGRVGALIELHVPAKRYLVTVDPEYRHRLSPGSLRTLAAQGEELPAADVAAFEADPHHRAAVALRRADEGAKVAGIHAGRIADWVHTLDAVIRRHG